MGTRRSMMTPFLMYTFKEFSLKVLKSEENHKLLLQCAYRIDLMFLEGHKISWVPLKWSDWARDPKHNEQIQLPFCTHCRQGCTPCTMFSANVPLAQGEEANKNVFLKVMRKYHLPKRILKDIWLCSLFLICMMYAKVSIKTLYEIILNLFDYYSYSMSSIVH